MSDIRDPGITVTPRTAEQILRAIQSDWSSEREHLERTPLGGWPQVRGPVGQNIIPFELIVDATAGGSAVDYQAIRLQPTSGGGGYAVPMSTGSTGGPDSTYLIHVLDLSGAVRALGYNTMHPTSSSTGDGARGWASKSALPSFGTNQDCWSIIDIQSQSTICDAFTTSGVDSGDSSYTVNTVTPLDCGQSPVASSTQTLTVSNWAAWQADTSGRECTIVADGSGGWKFNQGGCWASPSTST